jgi:hypothetical protein
MLKIAEYVDRLVPLTEGKVAFGYLGIESVVFRIILEKTIEAVNGFLVIAPGLVDE